MNRPMSTTLKQVNDTLDRLDNVLYNQNNKRKDYYEELKNDKEILKRELNKCNEQVSNINKELDKYKLAFQMNTTQFKETLVDYMLQIQKLKEEILKIINSNKERPYQQQEQLRQQQEQLRQEQQQLRQEQQRLAKLLEAQQHLANDDKEQHSADVNVDKQHLQLLNSFIPSSSNTPNLVKIPQYANVEDGHHEAQQRLADDDVDEHERQLLDSFIPSSSNNPYLLKIHQDADVEDGQHKLEQSEPETAQSNFQTNFWSEKLFKSVSLRKKWKFIDDQVRYPVSHDGIGFVKNNIKYILKSFIITEKAQNMLNQIWTETAQTVLDKNRQTRNNETSENIIERRKYFFYSNDIQFNYISKIENNDVYLEMDFDA